MSRLSRDRRPPGRPLAPTRRAFSLVEVVVAVGVFVAGVVGALALLSSTTNQTSQTRDVLTATRVGESTLAWLRDQPRAVITAAVEAGADGAYWSDRDGSRHSWHEPLPATEGYFLITVEAGEDLVETGPAGESLGQRHRLRVSWPLWQAPGQRTATANLESLTFNLVAPR